MTEAVDLSVRARGFLQRPLVLARTQHTIEVGFPVSTAEFFQRRRTTDRATRFWRLPEACGHGGCLHSTLTVYTHVHMYRQQQRSGLD